MAKLNATDALLIAWASAAAAGDLVQPGAGQSGSGYLAGQKPPHEEFNALMRQATACKPEYENIHDAIAALAPGETGVVQRDTSDTTPFLAGTGTTPSVIDGGGAFSIVDVAADGQYIFWLGSDGDITTTDADGTVIWTQALAAVAIATDGRFVYTVSGTSVTKRDRTDGSALSSATLSSAPNDLAADGAFLYLVGDDLDGAGNDVVRFDVTDVTTGNEDSAANLGEEGIAVSVLNQEVWINGVDTVFKANYALSQTWAKFTLGAGVNGRAILATPSLILVGIETQPGTLGNVFALVRGVNSSVDSYTIWDSTDTAVVAATQMPNANSIAWDGGNIICVGSDEDVTYGNSQFYRLDNGALMAVEGSFDTTSVVSDGFQFFLGSTGTGAAAGVRRPLRKGPVMVTRESGSDNARAWNKLFTMTGQPW